MRAFLIPSVALLLAACGSTSVTVPDEPGFITGPIVAVNANVSFSSHLPTIHVKPADDNCGVIFAIDDESVLVERDDDGDLREVTVDELKVGRLVRVWTDVVATSCPAQGRVQHLELLGR